MNSQIVMLALVSLAAGACRPSQQARVRAYEARELHCIQQYRDGEVQTAKDGLFDYLRLVQEEEASGLPFYKTAWTKAVAITRLALICQHLGDTGEANHYLQEAVAYAKKDAQEEGSKTWSDKTDEQIATSLINFVNKLDENTHPKWRRK